jgi:glucose uptake protein GlcU
MGAGGYLAAVGSALCNGSFGTISKLDRVQKAAIPFPVFAFWNTVGIVISSIFFLAATPRVFTPWGLLSGLFFVLSMAGTFLAIARLGLGSATGIWSGTAIVVSFTWGVKVQGEEISKAGLAAPGMILLVIGLVVIAFNGQAASSRRKLEAKHQQDQLMDGDVERSAEVDEPGSGGPRPHINVTGYPLGLIASVATGVFGGLVLGPMYYAPEEAKGVQYIPSMALGVVISSPIITALMIYVSGHRWSLHTTSAALPGILSGFIWNAGNALSIIATMSSGVGLAVAYPIMQAGLFVAGLWGIILFNELKLVREQITYWIGGVVLIVGATLLAFSK